SIASWYGRSADVSRRDLGAQSGGQMRELVLILGSATQVDRRGDLEPLCAHAGPRPTAPDRGGEALHRAGRNPSSRADLCHSVFIHERRYYWAMTSIPLA